jgi:sensor histidine kinase YesM
MTLQARKDLASTVVICKVWMLTVTLYLLVITSRVYKWSINQISYTKPRLQLLILDNMNSQWLRLYSFELYDD